jgi:hypothetical protein
VRGAHLAARLGSLLIAIAKTKLVRHESQRGGLDQHNERSRAGRLGLLAWSSEPVYSDVENEPPELLEDYNDGLASKF